MSAFETAHCSSRLSTMTATCCQRTTHFHPLTPQPVAKRDVGSVNFRLLSTRIRHGRKIAGTTATVRMQGVIGYSGRRKPLEGNQLVMTKLSDYVMTTVASVRPEKAFPRELQPQVRGGRLPRFRG